MPYSIKAMHHRRRRNGCQRGFTLIEVIMVIVIMGVVGSMIAVFMRGPIDAYADASRRAALTDVADTTARRMARDISRALPNSIRQSIAPAAANNQCIEFIPTKTGGRYRADQSPQGLNFDAADAGFNMLGNNAARTANQHIVGGDFIVVYNLGIAGADAYAGNTISQLDAAAPQPAGTASAPETALTFIAPMLFPLASPGNRFQVVSANERIVSYVCNNGRLLRSANHPFNTSCPTTAQPGATLSVMSDSMGVCNFVYNVGLQADALVQLNMTFDRRAGGAGRVESINLYHEVHVDNTP